MGLSSGALLHQTDYDGLRAILRGSTFLISYSLEDIYCFGGDHYSAAFPMVSFSDIPFSELGSHLGKYGNFTIGMKRDWAMKTGFTPVCYYDPGAPIIKNIIDRCRFHSQSGQGNTADLETYLYQLAHSKNYEGRLKVRSTGKEYGNYRFSDEREWRFVPMISRTGGIDGFSIPAERYDPADKKNYRGRLYGLGTPFTIDDISYIVVHKQEQLAYFKDYIARHYFDLRNGCDWNTVNINFFTEEQVKKDIFGTGHDVEVLSIK